MKYKFQKKENKFDIKTAIMAKAIYKQNIKWYNN